MKKFLYIAMLSLLPSAFFAQNDLSFSTSANNLRIKKTFINNTDKHLVLKWAVYDPEKKYSYKQEPLVPAGKTIVLDFNEAVDYIKSKVEHAPMLEFSFSVLKSSSLPKKNKRLVGFDIKNKWVKDRTGDPDHAVAYEAKSAQIETYKKVKGSIMKLTKNNFLNHSLFEFYSSKKEPISLNLL